MTERAPAPVTIPPGAAPLPPPKVDGNRPQAATGAGEAARQPAAAPADDPPTPGTSE